MSREFEPIRLSAVKPSDGVDRNRKLGKGLNALLGETRQERAIAGEGGSDGNVNDAGPAASELQVIPVGQIEPLPGQPRTAFDETALTELAASITARGLIQPIIVRQLAENRYQLVAGERRWRAAQIAQLHEIPALIRALDDAETMAVALVENLQREDLNPIEEARAYRRLSDENEMTQADIAKLVDKSRSHVANLQRLLSLPEIVQDMVASGRLSMGHARALIGHHDAERLARSAADTGMSVRELERAARRPEPTRGRDQPTSRRAADVDEDIAAVQGHLEEFLGLPVKIVAEGNPSKGAVTVRYRTLDQLDLICQRLTGGKL